MSLGHRLSAAIVALLAAVGLARGAQAQADLSVAHGPFEIMAKGKRVGAGGFPNTSSNPFLTVEVTAFSVRWRGQVVNLPKVGTEFWRVLRLLDAAQPALLVSTTDFHLLTERDGQLQIQRFGQPSSDSARLQWLDSANGQPGPVLTYGVEKLREDKGIDLSGGRWLRLSHHTVLDVKTLRSYPIRPWVPSGSGQPMAGLNASVDQARGFSPGASQLVMVGGTNSNQWPNLALLVIDITSGDAYGVPIDPKRQRLANAAYVTPEWLAHYYQWQRDTAGRERLIAQPSARPLPWQGRLIKPADSLEYRVDRIDAAFVPVVRQLLIEKLAASVIEGNDAAKNSRWSLKVAGCDHKINLSWRELELTIYAEQGPSPPWVRCQDTVRRIGELLNAELASGRHDKMLVL